MAWGLEARVPFLDKAFLDVALNTDAKEKMFSKGASQQVDEDGRPKMEKVGLALPSDPRARACGSDTAAPFSTSSAKPSISPPTARFAAGSSRSECMMMADPPSCLDSSQPYLPRSILWRQKEQFSDGVGYSWIDGYALAAPRVRCSPLTARRTAAE